MCYFIVLISSVFIYNIENNNIGWEGVSKLLIGDVGVADCSGKHLLSENTEDNITSKISFCCHQMTA